MSNEFSVVARRGFQSRVVGTYDSFADAADAIMMMREQGGSLGFHIGYDVLYQDKPIFWKQSYAETAKEVVDVLVSFNKLFYSITITSCFSFDTIIFCHLILLSFQRTHHLR